MNTYRLELELQLPLLTLGFTCQLSSTIASLILPNVELQILLPLPLPVHSSGIKKPIICDSMVLYVKTTGVIF